MILTAQDLIKSSLRVIGALAKNEAPPADELADGLQALNMMLGLWSARKLMILATVYASFPLTALKASYTIGASGADFTTSKPKAITDAFIRDSLNVDSSLELITMEEYSTYNDKDYAAARPIALAYDPGLTQQTVQTGTIWIYYMPDNTTSYTLFIGQTKSLTSFSALTDTFTFDEAYEEAVKFNLAIRLYREYHEHGKPIPEDIVYLAKNSMKVIETMNARQVTAAIEVPGLKGPYNIYTDSWLA